VFVGLAMGGATTITRELRLPGQREQIRQYAVISSLDLLRRQLHLRAEGLAS
jgi:nicotinamide mononucleotide (NMN) deamidase PncC